MAPLGIPLSEEEASLTEGISFFALLPFSGVPKGDFIPF